MITSLQKEYMIHDGSTEVENLKSMIVHYDKETDNLLRKRKL